MACTHSGLFKAELFKNKTEAKRFIFALMQIKSFCCLRLLQPATIRLHDTVSHQVMYGTLMCKLRKLMFKPLKVFN